MRTIEFKLRNNIYTNPYYFHVDMKRMWKNSRQYNYNNAAMMTATASLEKRYQKLLAQYRPLELDDDKDVEENNPEKK